jgi:SAM-dependent methyltransferase
VGQQLGERQRVSAGSEVGPSDASHGGSSRSEAETSPDHQHWFEPIAEHLGTAYLRYSFTKGTGQEVDFLVDALSLSAGDRVLDVGCGPGRHAHELARRGIVVHGVDISQRFVDLAIEAAPPGATFERLDARTLPFRAEFDAAVCLCQGAFGLMTAEGENQAVLSGIAAALKPGGKLALSAFSSYFVVKYHESATFDVATGISHERTEVRDEHGEAIEVDLWTACFTPSELGQMCAQAGLAVVDVWSVEPGDYRRSPPSVETPEFLVIACCR